MNHAFLVELFDAAVELLIATRVEHTHGREKLGGEARDAGKVHLRSGEKRVTDAHVEGVNEPDHVTRVRLLNGLAFLPENRVGVLGGEGLAGGAVGDNHAALELAGAHASERNAIAMRTVHVGLHLEHEGAEVIIEMPNLTRVRRPVERMRCQVDNSVEQQPHAEVRER